MGLGGLSGEGEKRASLRDLVLFSAFRGYLCMYIWSR